MIYEFMQINFLQVLVKLTLNLYLLKSDQFLVFVWRFMPWQLSQSHNLHYRWLC